MNILVTGGAGYIGSFMVKALLDRGESVTVFDNLKRGHREAVDNRAQFVLGDILDLQDLNELFSKNKFDAVIHFAGLISVEESSKEPEKYYENNVVGSNNLFNSANEIGKVRNFIFSSTAAVYGNPVEVPIPEDHPKNPESPYGETKLAVEEGLKELKEKNPSVSYVALRYFNACGAALDGSLGENHDPETHIIPLAIKAAINNTEFKLFGTDYDTKDGTCIRDYIHALDLVEAHILALSKLFNDGGGYYYNVGTGTGFSNREVIEMVKKVSDVNFSIIEVERRAGDSSELVADVSKIKSELGFSPKYSDLRTIIESAWKWHANKK